MITESSTLSNTLLIISASDDNGNIVKDEHGKFLSVSATTDGQKLTIVDLVPSLKKTYLLNSNNPNVDNIVNEKFKQIYKAAMTVYSKTMNKYSSLLPFL
ncbi:hypothetical protein PIROE2DRAFT_9922 [Piromyces sp. E2]|nr:hypothetical protein PIROE2DRAFT_9922 [Piromyces sp. E2]|eukprot:OUM63505.1 hypothetical protein PIROE2DRAFT_9922 [Piromyces sp. E2]